MTEMQNAWPNGWHEHEQQQLERQARWSWEEKLQWLEDAHRLVLEMEKQKLPSQKPSTSPSHP